MKIEEYEVDDPLGDLRKNRDYWFFVANDMQDFLDWLIDTHTSYTAEELNQQYEQYQSSLTVN